ncbi:MAG: 5-formyltetrahydrofolate cyclo-ligase [Phyllobacterium sp.]
MTKKDREEEFGEYASPPCFMHELSDEYREVKSTDRKQWDDVRRWRKAERERLISARMAIDVDRRKLAAKRIAEFLDTLFPDLANSIVSFYWPFRGEPDLREWIAAKAQRNIRCALPVVTDKNAPLTFRSWQPGEPLTRGVWNIPVPERGAEVQPDLILAPVVGFDLQRYRLGYGGGFFDRTLAAARNSPKAIGIGYRQSAIPTIYPQPHDLAMEIIVTDEGFL